MRGLSGGQKVKVVLGAAMWNNPHILVLDEPTNYLVSCMCTAAAAAAATSAVLLTIDLIKYAPQNVKSGCIGQAVGRCKCFYLAVPH